MKFLKYGIYVWVGIILLWAGAGYAETASIDINYKIGFGDILNISVWKDEALTRQSVVLPDGKINFPLVGEVYAYGKTVQEIKKDIETRITRYVPEPVLSVEVVQTNSMMIYVIGRVNRPGNFPISNGVNVLQALAMAGGLNAFADPDEIKIFRQVNKKTVIYEFDYTEIEAGENLEHNLLLQRGDVILVP